MGRPVNVIDEATGTAYQVDESEVPTLGSGWRVETPQEGAARTTRQQIASDYSGPVDALRAVRDSALSTASLGLTDLANGDATNAESARIREAHPIGTGIGTAIGLAPALLSGGAGDAAAIARLTPAGAASRLGAALTRTGEGAGLATKAGRAFLGGGAEGTLYEAGGIASDAALSDDPVDMDHLAGNLSTGFLLNGVVGAGLGSLEHGLSVRGRQLKAAREAEDVAAAAKPAGAVIPEDIAGLDIADARAAQKAEHARIETEDLTPQRQNLVAEVKQWRDTTNETRPWDALATGNKEGRDAAKKVAAKSAAAAKKAERVAAQLDRATEIAGLPTYAKIGDNVVEKTIPARDLAGRVRGLDAGINESGIERARGYIAEGQRDPISVVVRGDGSYEVTNGRHRLLAAMEADAPIKMRIERGVAEVADDPTVLLGEKFARPERLAASQAAAEARATAAAARKAADDAEVAYRAAAEQVRERAPKWVRDASAQYIKADRHIDRLLNNMEGLTEVAHNGPGLRNQLRAALQEQRQVLQTMQDRAGELQKLHALDTSGARAKALAAVDDTLARNKALQARLDALAAPHASPRLDALAAHIDMLQTPRPPPTLGQKIKAAGVGAAVYGLAHAVLPGFAQFAAAPLAAAAGARMLAPVAKKAIAASRARQAEALGRFFSRAERGVRAARKVAVPLASKVLAEVRFGQGDGKERGKTLQDHFDARSAELARIMAPGPDGQMTVRPEVRRQMADRLAAMAREAPHVADRAETIAVKKLVFIDSKRPRAIRIGMVTIPPSEMAQRAWARYIAAAEDPGGIEERLADGSLSVEDAVTMRELYPERLADMQRMVVEHMGELRGTLGHQQRLRLSLLTGVALDPSLEPRILAQLQGAHTKEPGTDGGTQAPRPMPAFGSVKKPEPTPAQRTAANA